MPGHNPPVFIVGMPRTGTSIMYRTIQKLSGFQSTKLNLWETKIFKNSIGFNSNDLYYKSLLGFLGGEKEIYDEFLLTIKKYTDRLKHQEKIDNYKIITNINDKDGVVSRFKDFCKNKRVEFKWKRSIKRKIIKEYFRYALKCRQSKRIVEKTPHHYMNVHQILWTFPNARIIWMIRHPIDIITSSIKRAKIDEKYHNYWQPDNFIREFKGSFHMCNYYKHVFEKNIMVIKYEDFVKDPPNEFKKICQFINEPFCEEALIIKDHEIIKWNSPDAYLFSSIVNKTEKKWQEHLSMEDTEKIETALQNLMEEYGFDFYSHKEKK